jgi:pimeloyl-ACP methyl ester carboxylesterase
MNDRYQPRRPPTADECLVRGLRIHLTRWNGTNPHPIVLVHGFMDTGDTFQFIVDALSDEHTFIAPDLRGFGRSAWRPDGYWFPDYFGDLDGLLDALGCDTPVTLVGHSMGGNIAMMYAGLRPERVARVINIEGFGLPPSQAEQSPERLRRWLDQLRTPPEPSVFPSVDALAHLLRKRHPRLPAQRAEFIARVWTQVEADGRARLLFDPAHKRINPVLYRRHEAEACWRSVRAPLLYVLARNSEYLAQMGEFALPQTMSQIVPRLESCWIEDAGHMVHHEQPEALASAMDAFLRRHPLPSENACQP